MRMVYRIDTYNDMACYWTDVDTLGFLAHLEYNNQFLEKSKRVIEFLITYVTYNLQKFKHPELYSAKPI